MALIPTGGAGQPIDRRTREANVSVGQAGLVGDALSGLGKEVMDSALQFEHQRRNAEAQSYALEKSVESETAVQRYALERKANRKPGETDDSYAADVRNFANEQFRNVQDNAPTDLAKSVYQQRSEADLNRYALHAELDQGQYNSGVYKERNFNAINQSAANQLQYPDQAIAQKQLANTWSSIDSQVGSNFDVKSAEEAKQYAHKEMARSVIEGHIQNENFNQAQAVLNGNDGTSDKMPKLRDGLTPEQMVSLQNKIDAGKKSKVAKLGHEYSQQSSDLLAAMGSGMNVPESVVLNQVEKNKALVTDQASNDAVRRTNYEMIQNYAASQALNDLKSRPTNELVNGLDYISNQTNAYTKNRIAADPSLRPPADTPFFQQADKERMYARAGRMIDQELKARENDGFSYVAENDPKVSQLARSANPSNPESILRLTDQAVYAQKQLGIQNIRVMSKDQSEQMGQDLMAQSDPAIASAKILQYQQMFGNNFHKAIHEMAGNDDIASSLILVGTAENPKVRERMFENSKRSKEFAKSFKDLRPSEVDDIRRESASQLQNFSYSLIQNDKAQTALPFANAMHDQVVTEAYKLASQDKFRGASVSTLVSEAKKNVIDSEFKTVSASGGNILMPNYSSGIPNSDVQLKKYVDASLKPENIKSFQTKVPAAFSQQYLQEHPGSHPDFIQNAWNTELQKNARWVTSDDIDGVKMVYMHPSSGQYDVLDRKGNKVVVPFRDITSNIAMEHLKGNADQVPPLAPQMGGNAMAGEKK